MITNKRIKTQKTIGGKIKLLPLLIPIIEYSIREYGLMGFFDIFGGGNKLIPHLNTYVLYKLYNDFDEGFSNLFVCTTDWYKTIEMINTTYYLRNTIKTEEDFENARKERRSKETSVVKSAALTILVQEFSRAADRVRFCESNVNRGISYKSLERYKELYPIMKNVTVTCTDYKVLIEMYKEREDIFWYLDPPYWGSDIYEDGFSNEEHYVLAEKIKNIRSKAMISNSDNPAYKILEDNGWYKYSLGMIVKTSAAKKGKVQEEWIWTNFEIPSYLLPKQHKYF